MVFGHEAGRVDRVGLITKEEHQRVLDGSRDVPKERPAFSLPLAEVGISRKTVWANIAGSRLPFDAALSVNLPAHRRGIHMSRIEEAISELFDQSFDDLRGYGVELGRRMIKRQEATSGKVSLSGKIPIFREASVSKERSLDAVDIMLEVLLSKKADMIEERVIIGAGVNHITACPCTQVYNAALFNSDEERYPYPTHSQRSHTTLSMESNRNYPTYQDILSCLESALHVTQDLLKRPDEAEIVLKSHREPQFAEDTVRATAMEVARRFGGKLPGNSKVIIESLSLESIHIHDVRCRTELTLAEIENSRDVNGFG